MPPPSLIAILNDIFLGSLVNRPVQPVVLPRDEFMHGVAVEWWYFVGHLKETVQPANRFAFEMTALRLTSRIAVPLDTCYVSVIDLTNQEYVSADRQSASAYRQGTDWFALEFAPPLGQPGLWTIRGTSAPSLQYQLDAAFQVPSTRQQRALHLTFTDVANKPVLLHGNNGIVPIFGLEVGYYSRTRLAVSGGLKLDARLLLVDGDGWMDHEYGVADLANSRWIFVAVQLFTGEELCVVRLTNRNDGTQGLCYAWLVPVSGQTDRAVPTVTPYDGVYNPGGYPLRNRIEVTFPVNGAKFDLNVEPEFDRQRRVPTGETALPFVTFWEGAAKVFDHSSGQVRGRAFLELAGYE
jgi:predicted secreted hydrolase